MRAAAASAIRRLLPRYSISSGGGLHRHSQSQNQSGYCFNPHWDYTNRLARPRALLDFSPCHPRWSSPSSPRSVASPQFFCSLSGTEEEEAVVLDMDAGTVRCAANHAPLSPISFIERAAAVYGARPAVVYGDRRHTWAETRGRCLRVAAALATRFGIAQGDVVSVSRLLASHPVIPTTPPYLPLLIADKF